MRKEGHKRIVDNCIGSIKAHSSDYEFIIINDGSPLTYMGFDTADTLITHKKSKGIATSWNDGLKVARGKYLVVINDDITVRPGWLEAMVEALKEVSGSLASSISVEHLPVESGITDTRTWFPGSCFMLTRTCIKKVGYFDERFSPFYFEDVDYWTRLHKVGKVARNYKVGIKHEESDVLHKFKENGEINKKNRDLYLEKWGFDPIPVLYHGTEKFPWENENNLQNV